MKPETSAKSPTATAVVMETGTLDADDWAVALAASGHRGSFARASCSLHSLFSTKSSSPVKGEVKEPEQHLRKTPIRSKTPKKSKKNGVEARNLATLMTDEMRKASIRSTPKKASITPKRRSKKAEWSSEDEEEAEEPREHPAEWKAAQPFYDGVVTPKDLAIEKITYKPGGYFIGKYKVHDLVDVNERTGATYIASYQGYELVLRINYIKKDDMELLNTEAKFLEMMELNGAQHFVSTIFDLGLVNKHKVDGKNWYATIYRGGPTLQQCLTLRHEIFKSETVDRLGAQMIKIFEQICGLGYRIVSFSPDDFTVDRRSREVFLNNYTNIVKAADKEEIVGEKVKEMIKQEKKRRNSWEGDEDFAPVKWHVLGEDHVMSEMDTMESLVYMLIHLHTGGLPWKDREDKAAWKMIHAQKDKTGALLNYLPPALRCLWYLVRNADVVSFPLIYRIFTRFTVEDEDFRYDWETVEYPSDDQERLIHLGDMIRDTKRRMKVMESIFENEAQLAKR